MKKRILLMILLGSFIFFIACSSDKKDYYKTKEANTIAAYEDFIQKHPNSRYVEFAQQNIDSIRYVMVISKNTIDAYEEFIQNYPNSNFYEKALEYVAEFYFNMAKSKHTIASYNKFMEKYSENKYTNQAKEILTKLLEQKKIILIKGTINEKDGSPCKGKSIIAYPLNGTREPISLYSFTVNGFVFMNPQTKCDLEGHFVIELPYISNIGEEKITGISLGLNESFMKHPKSVKMYSIDYGEDKGLLVTIKKGNKGLSILKKSGKIISSGIGKEIKIVDFGMIILE